MANWRNLALAAILADGKIGADEIKVLRKELWADGKIDRAEAEFLVELRNAAKKKSKSGRINPIFEKFFFQAVEHYVLADGVVSAAEAKWLKEVVYADKKVDVNEKKFLKALQRKAKKTSPQFEALCAACAGK